MKMNLSPYTKKKDIRVGRLRIYGGTGGGCKVGGQGYKWLKTDVRASRPSVCEYF